MVDGISLERVGQDETRALDDNDFQANVGELVAIHCVIVIDGQPVEPVAVIWQLGDPNGFVMQYSPTVQSAHPNFNIDLTANPITFFPWNAEQTQPTQIMVEAQAHDGQWVAGTGTLTVTPNGYEQHGDYVGTIQLQGLPSGNTLVAFDGEDPATQPGIALGYTIPGGANYPGYLGGIQIVSSVRYFHTAARDYYLTNTQGAFVLDAASTQSDYVYSKVDVELGEIPNYTFNDTPNQELLPVIEGNTVESFVVNESFALFPVASGSTLANPNIDPSQIWFPVVALTTWGWSATVVNDGKNNWTIQASAVQGPESGPLDFPQWDGTIRDYASSPGFRLRDNQERAPT